MTLRLLALGLLFAAPAWAETPIESAIALYKAKQYPEAQAALEKITAAEPTNAAACHYLGLTLQRSSDPARAEESVNWLKKASDLEPANAAYLADYGGASMESAGRLMATNKLRAIGAATDGRDAMEKSLTMDPNNLDARSGLVQFYMQAPWPIGSNSKAYAQAEEINQRDTTLGLITLVALKLNDKKYDEAFALCEERLKIEPDNFIALQQLGRTASISGENLDRGIAALQKCLTLPPPPKYSPQPAGIPYRLGTLFAKKGNFAAARSAYETALKLDPKNKAASDALAKLP
jgi:tetratricopeptide (TPR) repeat protein